MRVVAIIQARMGSTRLPHKVLLDLAGQPMLVREISRIQRAQTLTEIVVATTTARADDAIMALGQTHGWHVFRGSEQDVLDRYYQAARQYQADVVIRLTADCPLLDPQLIDRVVELFLEQSPALDYASNCLPHYTYPRGLDVEVFSFAALERTWREDQRAIGREHVTPYLEHRPDLFRQAGLMHSSDLTHLRWTVDTIEDYNLMQEIFAAFPDDTFSWEAALELCNARPELQHMNQHIVQKQVLPNAA